MFRYSGFGYISYSEIPGQLRQDIAAVQKKFVFSMKWLYIHVNVIHKVLYKRGLFRHVLVVGHVEVKEAT